MRRPRDRPLQPDDPERARLRGPRRVPRRASSVEITASLPCYTKDNVDRQRGDDVFDSSILALQKLNALGLRRRRLGPRAQPRLQPARPVACRPRRTSSRPTTSASSATHFGIVFNQLFTLANMPIKRFGSTLVTQGKFASYMALLHSAHNPRQSRRRDVPHARVGRLPRLSLRLRFQPDARHPARRRRQAAAPSVADLLTTSSTARRSPWPTIATAAPPDRARAAAARSPEQRAESAGRRSRVRVSIIVPALERSAPHRRDARAVAAAARARATRSIVVDGGSTRCDARARRAARRPRVRRAARARRADERRRGAAQRATCCCSCTPIRGCPTAASRRSLDANGSAPDGAGDASTSRSPGASACLPLVARDDECALAAHAASRPATRASSSSARSSTAIGGYPDQPLMEDIELSRRLEARGGRAAVPRASASSRRAGAGSATGPWRTIVAMWRLRFAYWRGADPRAARRAATGRHARRRR